MQQLSNNYKHPARIHQQFIRNSFEKLSKSVKNYRSIKFTEHVGNFCKDSVKFKDQYTFADVLRVCFIHLPLSVHVQRRLVLTCLFPSSFLCSMSIPILVSIDIIIALTVDIFLCQFIEPAERETRRAPKGRTCPQNMRNLYIKLYIYVYIYM